MTRETTSAGGVVLNPSGDVLVVNQRGNSWSLPKGHVDKGEDLETAARREVHEESGVSELVTVRKLGSYKRHRIGRSGEGEDTGELKHLHFFLFRTRQIELRPIDSDNPEARWVSPDRVEEMLTHPADRAFFRSVAEAIRDEE